MGSKTGAQLRTAIMQERDQLIQAGKDDAPRDSELSAGKYQEDYDKVRQARVRVQARLLQGNAVNSSDEEDNNPENFAENTK